MSSELAGWLATLDWSRRASPGPAQLAMAVVDRDGRPLAVGPVPVAGLVPEVHEGRLALVGRRQPLVIVAAGLPARAWLLVVNADDGSYQPVTPVELGAPEAFGVKVGDTLELAEWWWLHEAKEAGR